MSSSYSLPTAASPPNTASISSHSTSHMPMRLNCETRTKIAPSLVDYIKPIKKKKARTTFSGRQIFELERQFEIKKYLSSSERCELAKLLDVTETQSNLIIAMRIGSNAAYGGFSLKKIISM
ncbi:unnamed protein product [Dracunculus medinensis]|uniref:Homeobox domain-containing protein n=1 Tax=Dracunculus medinensis TaxID=318479 RepID=A0A158Q3A1_DRAME|nr:unnamed protein product [Dracunculus medinensis]